MCVSDPRSPILGFTVFTNPPNSKQHSVGSLLVLLLNENIITIIYQKATNHIIDLGCPNNGGVQIKGLDKGGSTVL